MTARRSPLLVFERRREQRFAPLHQLAQQVGSGTVWQVRFDELIGDVVRRCCLSRDTERSRRTARPIDEQIAIADSGVELPMLTTTLIALQGFDERLAE